MAADGAHRCADPGCRAPAHARCPLPGRRCRTPGPAVTRPRSPSGSRGAIGTDRGRGGSSPPDRGPCEVPARSPYGTRYRPCEAGQLPSSANTASLHRAGWCRPAPRAPQARRANPEGDRCPCHGGSPCGEKCPVTRWLPRPRMTPRSGEPTAWPVPIIREATPTAKEGASRYVGVPHTETMPVRARSAAPESAAAANRNISESVAAVKVNRPGSVEAHTSSPMSNEGAEWVSAPTAR